MSNCKDCIHNDVCQALEDKNSVPKVGSLHCGFFSSSSEYIKKPCEIGTEIFGILEVSGRERVLRGVVRRIAIDKEGVWIYIHFFCGLDCWEIASQLNKTIFFSEEAARVALSEENAG